MMHGCNNSVAKDGRLFGRNSEKVSRPRLESIKRTWQFADLTEGPKRSRLALPKKQDWIKDQTIHIGAENVSQFKAQTTQKSAK